MGAWRTGPAAAAFAALIAVTAWGLYRFAQHEFDVHLLNQAAKALALAATGGTPYQWRFATPDDVIAGHPFGTEDFEFSAGALHWRSSGAVEVGVVLARTVSLRSFPQLRLDLDAAEAGELRVVVRETLGEQEFVSAPVPFAAGHLTANLDLSDLAWFAESMSHAAAAPRNAA